MYRIITIAKISRKLKIFLANQLGKIPDLQWKELVDVPSNA